MDKIGTKSKTKKLVQSNDFRIKKKFGQNFLTDQNILQKIVSVSGVDKTTLAIEIGPGMGSLTEHLIQNAKHVLAYEIDTDLIPILQKQFEKEPFTLIEGDFLENGFW